MRQFSWKKKHTNYLPMQNLRERILPFIFRLKYVCGEDFFKSIQFSFQLSTG